MAISAGASAELNVILIGLQQFLFDLGADICVPLPAEGQSDLLSSRISVQDAEHLEQLIDRFTERQAALNSFVLPGGSPAASHLHFARSVCRRAELEVLRLQDAVAVNSAIAICLNRLSDLLFVLARAANDDGRNDVLWQPDRSKDRA